MNIEVQKKPQKEYSKDIQIKRSTDVLNLEEVKEIRNATQEHLILLGLDRSMNLRTVKYYLQKILTGMIYVNCSTPQEPQANQKVQC